jgi:hypothetical protein
MVWTGISLSELPYHFQENQFKNRNMKNGFVGLLLLISGQVFSQLTVTEQFQKINTVQDAQKYIEGNAALKPALLKLSWGKDTTLIDKRLLRQKRGDVFSVGYVTYKVLEATDTVSYRSSYIFLDESQLNKFQIDSLKKIIVQKLNEGVPFAQLSDQYTMDGNTTHGDTGWSFGEYTMPKEYDDAVKNHKTGDIFVVEVPDKQWYYLVKKTFDDQIKKDITVLRSNGR